MPSVTSVGATEGTGTEKAASFSSGGFSNIFARPSFQSTQTINYISEIGDLNRGKYNASGRGFPDVSLYGIDFEIIVNGDTMKVDGTSCSTPTFASVIALINSELIAGGLPVLGWLNPFLYEVGTTAIVDITSGDNPGCGTNGFPAEFLWDPVCLCHLCFHRVSKTKLSVDHRSGNPHVRPVTPSSSGDPMSAVPRHAGK